MSEVQKEYSEQLERFDVSVAPLRESSHARFGKFVGVMSIATASLIGINHNHATAEGEVSIDPPPASAGSTTSVDLGNEGDVAVVNLTALGGQAYHQIVAPGDQKGAYSTLNVDAGMIRSTFAATPLGPGGRADIFTNAGGHQLIDLLGRYNSENIVNTNNRRLLDTRNPEDPARVLPAGSFTVLKVPVEDVATYRNQVVQLNLIAVDAKENGWVQALTNIDDVGKWSNVNINKGQTANRVLITQLDDNGQVLFFNSSPMNIVVDEQLQFAEGSFEVVNERILDTRNRSNKPNAGSTTIIYGEPNRSAQISVVADNAESVGWVQVAGMSDTFGSTSTININKRGDITGGATIATFNEFGWAAINTSIKSDFVVDLQGYYSEGVFIDSPDARYLDTRGNALRGAVVRQIAAQGIQPVTVDMIQPSCETKIATNGSAMQYQTISLTGLRPNDIYYVGGDRTNISGWTTNPRGALARFSSTSFADTEGNASSVIGVAVGNSEGGKSFRSDEITVTLTHPDGSRSISTFAVSAVCSLGSF